MDDGAISNKAKNKNRFLVGLEKHYHQFINNIKQLYGHDSVYEEYVKENSQSKEVNKDAAISVRNLFFKYNKKQNHFTINDCSFDVSKGSFYVFVGENGSGKTTIIKAICGANKNYIGDIFINNKNFLIDKTARLPITYIQTKPIFPNEFNVYEYLLMMGLLVRNDINNLKEEIDFNINKFKISEIKHSNPNKLSSGQQQKVLLIKSIIEKASIYILDEPTANLDPITRIDFFRTLKELAQEKNITVFISSHSLDEIKEYVNEATFIKAGKVLFTGKVNGKNLINKYEEMFFNKQTGAA